MASNNGNREIREWLRARGETPSARGALARRHMELWWDAHPSERPEGALRPLPPPGLSDDEIDEYEDLGIMMPEIEPEAPEEREGPRVFTAVPDGPPAPDEPPAHGKRDWARSTPRRAAPGKPLRVTGAIRTDINAKVSFALEIPGRVWQARDPVCGSAFVEQRPAIADALTEIVCQSADLVAWFTGSGGQFMLWLNLAAACWPVATIMMAHHVYHTLEEAPEDMQQPTDYGRYAA